MRMLLSLSLALCLTGPIATASTTYNLASLLNTTDLADGQIGVYLLSLDGTALTAANISVSAGEDVRLSSTYGSSFQVLFTATASTNIFTSDTQLGSGYTVEYTGGISQGDSWAVLVFDVNNPTAGTNFDIFRDGSWTLPADPGGTLSYGTEITRFESVGPTELGAVIPEPSALLLTGLGGLMLLRRRRND